MVKKLSKHGENFAVILDKSILAKLNINEDTKFKIRTDGQNIIIEPLLVNGKKTIIKDKKIKKIYEEPVDKYGTDLKKLAD